MIRLSCSVAPWPGQLHRYVSFLISRDESVVHFRDLADRIFDGGANRFRPGTSAIIFCRLAQGSRVYWNRHKDLSNWVTTLAAQLGGSHPRRPHSFWFFFGRNIHVYGSQSGTIGLTRWSRVHHQSKVDRRWLCCRRIVSAASGSSNETVWQTLMFTLDET